MNEYGSRKNVLTAAICSFNDKPRGKLWSTLGAPSNLHYGNSALFQSFDFPVHDLNWFLHEIEFLVDLDFFQWNDKCLI
ncbi:hypothetical protein LXL04_020955 [Taraxacum kok-saghyz]